jgi:hypothetical protein
VNKVRAGSPLLKVKSVKPAKGTMQAAAIDRSGGPEVFTFVGDDQEVSKLPARVKTAKQTIDGHLVQVATTHGAVLAALDRKIPTALVIPPTPEDGTAQDI